jgi:hypothetical protein
LPESKEGVYLQPQKQRRFLEETGVVFKVLLRMESFKKKVKNFSKKDLAGKEKALYICSRLQRKQVPKNTEKKSRVGEIIERFESFNFDKNIPSKIGEVH